MKRDFCRKSIIVVLCFTLLIGLLLAAGVYAQSQGVKEDASVREKGIFEDVSFSPVLLAQTSSNRDSDKSKDLVYAADVISVSGSSFKIKRTNNPHWVNGRVNMPNYVMDVLETDKDTVACIEFLNGSQLGINKGTKVEIISSTDARDITQRGVVQKVILKSGTIWANITGRDSKGFRVETNKGALGVKGTEFIVESDPKANTEKVTVLEGEVEYSAGGKPSELVTPGEEIVFELDRPFVRHQRDIQTLRDALNLRLPGLNPLEQSIVSIFTHRAIGAIPGVGSALHQADRALSMANEVSNLIDNPAEHIASRAISEATSRVGLPFGVPIPGPSRPRERDPKENMAKNLTPGSGTVIKTYYPEFKWDKVDGASSYRVIVSREPLKKGVSKPGYIAFAQVKETSFKYTPTARVLLPGEKYYWTVIPLNKDNKPIAPAHAPVPITMGRIEDLGIRGMYPLGDIDSASNEFVFDWMPVRGISKYKFEVSQNSNMSSPIVTLESDFNSVTVENASSVLSKGKTYFWKVTPIEKADSVPALTGAVNSFVIKK